MASNNIKKIEIRLGKSGLIIVITGMTVLLCSAFLFGIVVGKNIDSYPEKIASVPQKLLALVWRPAKIKIAQTPADNKPVQNQPKTQEDVDLTFYNNLTSKKGMVKEQPIPEKKTVVEAAPTLLPPEQQKTAEKAAAPTINAETQKQAKPKMEAPVDEIEAKIKEAEPADAVSNGKFSVQVASLKERAKANIMHKKISTLGFTPKIVETIVPGKGTWFRVVVYGFNTKPNAQIAAEKISSKTGTICIVRRIDVAVKNN